MCTCNNQNLYNPCNICNPSPCQTNTDCECPTNLQTKCSTYEGEDLECSGIKSGTILTELIQQLDAFICEKVNDITNALTLKNIGLGARIYKGVDLLGRKEIRTVTKTGDLLEVTENADDINLTINETVLNTFIEDNQKTYSVENVGIGAEVYKSPDTIVGDNTTFSLKSLISNDNSIVITQNLDEIDLSVSSSTLQGLQNVIDTDSALIGNSLIDQTAGSNLIIYGGDLQPLFILNNTNPSTNTTPTTYVGIGDAFSQDNVGLRFYKDRTEFLDLVNSKGIVYSDDYEPNFTGRSLVTKTYVDSVTTGAETIVTGATDVNVTGVGTTGSPYVIETENLQKEISTFPYTLVDADNKNTIFVNNLAANVVINVPDSLVDNFSVVFIQKGSGSVTIQASGISTLNYPSSVLQNIIKGQFFWAMVEKEQSTNSYYLLGSLLPV